LPTSGYSGYSGLGLVSPATAPATVAATATLAHQRQRAEGRVPVGVSSSTKPAHDSQATTMAFWNPTSQAAAGSAPRRATSP
jgi:hypothetical protein